MNYEQRTKAIGAWLQKELQSYDVPANHTPERAATEMSAMVEDINSEIVSSINEEGLTKSSATWAKTFARTTAPDHGPPSTTWSKLRRNAVTHTSRQF